jgi:hypothetical protein
MVKHKLKRHFITKGTFVKGDVYRIDWESRGRVGHYWFNLTIDYVADGDVYYHCESNHESYNNQLRSTEISNAKSLVETNYWIRQ